jgi:small-conductance mechanosensitive channel
MFNLAQVAKTIAPFWKELCVLFGAVGVAWAYWKARQDIWAVTRARGGSATYQDVVLTQILKSMSRMQYLMLILIFLVSILVLLTE